MDACDIVDHRWERMPVKLHSHKWPWNPRNYIMSMANIHVDTVYVLLAEWWNDNHPTDMIKILPAKQVRRELGLQEMHYNGCSGYWFEYEQFGTFSCLLRPGEVHKPRNARSLQLFAKPKRGSSAIRQATRLVAKSYKNGVSLVDLPGLLPRKLVRDNPAQPTMGFIVKDYDFKTQAFVLHKGKFWQSDEWSKLLEAAAPVAAPNIQGKRLDLVAPSLGLRFMEQVPIGSNTSRVTVTHELIDCAESSRHRCSYCGIQSARHRCIICKVPLHKATAHNKWPCHANFHNRACLRFSAIDCISRSDHILDPQVTAVRTHELSRQAGISPSKRKLPNYPASKSYMSPPSMGANVTKAAGSAVTTKPTTKRRSGVESDQGAQAKKACKKKKKKK